MKEIRDRKEAEPEFMSLSNYNSAQRGNLLAFREHHHLTQLFSLVDSLYLKSVKLVPKDAPARYGRFLLLCHQHFVSAATLIAQGQPYDAAPITRRAIEIARVSLASKLNPANAKKWLSYEKRQARWAARQVGSKPPFLPPIKYDLPINHPILNRLKVTEGVLSDGCVHFTPEYFGNQNWSYERGAGETKIRLSYFISVQPTIEREVVLLTGTHAKILKIFDECFGGALHRSDVWPRLMSDLDKQGDKVVRGIPRPKIRRQFGR